MEAKQTIITVGIVERRTGFVYIRCPYCASNGDAKFIRIGRYVRTCGIGCRVIAGRQISCSSCSHDVQFRIMRIMYDSAVKL